MDFVLKVEKSELLAPSEVDIYIQRFLGNATIAPAYAQGLWRTGSW